MKAVFCKVFRAPKQGDELRLCYKHKVRGGMTEAAVNIDRSHFWRTPGEGEDVSGRETWLNQPEPTDPGVLYVKMTEAETCEAVAESLSKVIAQQWMGEMFCSRARGNEIVITTTIDDHVYFPMLNGVVPEGYNVIQVEE